MRVPAVAVALWLVPTLAAPQSLGEAARKQARKRSAGAPASKVYTETDLRPSGERLEEVVTAPAAETNAAAPGAPAGLPAAGKPASVRLPEPGSGWPPTTPGLTATTGDAVRAQLDREEAIRKQQERSWRQRASQVLARLEATQREYDATCGRGLIVVVGG